MDEVYTCVCGNQKWEIHDGWIRCGWAKCRNTYSLSNLFRSPKEFNENIKGSDEEKKETKPTLEELELLLESKGHDGIEIMPDGSVREKQKETP